MTKRHMQVRRKREEPINLLRLNETGSQRSRGNDCRHQVLRIIWQCWGQIQAENYGPWIKSNFKGLGDPPWQTTQRHRQRGRGAQKHREKGRDGSVGSGYGYWRMNGAKRNIDK